MSTKGRKLANKDNLILRVEQEIKSGYRNKELDGKVVRIYLPSGNDNIDITNYRDKITTQLFKDENLLTQDEAVEILKKRGVWDKDKQKEEQKLRDRLQQCVMDIWMEHAIDEPNQDTLKELERERLSVNIDLDLLTASKEKLFGSTIERKIEELVREYMFIICLKDESGNRIFNSLEELRSYQNQEEIDLLKSEALFFWHRLDPSMFSFAPVKTSEDSSTGAVDSENLQDQADGN